LPSRSNAFNAVFVAFVALAVVGKSREPVWVRGFFVAAYATFSANYSAWKKAARLIGSTPG
jgi:hypothetical protein